MNAIGQDLAVQSWCFRNFKPLPRLIEQVKGIGLSAIELCGVHVDFNNEASFDGVVETFKKAGVRIVSIGVEGFSNDEAAERKRFEFVKRAGARHISANFNPNTMPGCFRTAEKLADQYDIQLGIHNHGGYHWLGSAEMLGWVFANTSRRIGLCLDTAWSMQAGVNPIEMVEKFADRLSAVHFKDFIFDRAGKHQDVVVGTGNLDLKKLTALVQAKAPNSLGILEYEGDVENPGPALSECVKAIRAIG